MAGGLVGSRYGWRDCVHAGGRCRASRSTILAWRLGDPPRGAPRHSVRRRAEPASEGFLEGVLRLFRTPTFVMVCAVGMLVAFSIGAFNHWLPLYLHRVKQFSVAEASFWFGILSATGGFLGVVSGRPRRGSASRGGPRRAPPHDRGGLPAWPPLPAS